MEMIQYVPAVLTVLGGLNEYEGATQAGGAAADTGRMRRVASEFQAEQMEQQAGQRLAVAQRAAIEERRRGTLVQSRALALAAASGASATDASVIRVLSRTAGEASYRAAVQMYEGEEAARTLRMSAGAKRYEGYLEEVSGDNMRQAYETRGEAALFKTAGSLFSKYGMGGPKAPGSADPAAMNLDGFDFGGLENILA